MPASYTTLTLRTSDNALSANLVDGTNYALKEGGWSPSVAPIRLTNLAIGCPYEDVDETITLDVLGSTTAIMLANLATLSQLLDQADRWARGENVSPVLLDTQPQGSTQTSVLTTLVLGRAGDQALITLPSTFNDLLFAGEVSTVQLSFRRRGQWYGASENDTTAAVNSKSAAAVTVSFPSSLSTGDHPLALDVSGWTTDTGTALRGGFAVTTASSSKLAQFDAQVMTRVQGATLVGTTGGSSELPVASGATPLVKLVAAGILTRTFTGPIPTSEVSILASVRPTSSTAAVTMSGSVTMTGGSNSASQIVGGDSTPGPRWIAFGPFAAAGQVTAITLSVYADGTTNGVEIDQVVVVADAQIVGLQTFTSGTTSGTLTIDPLPLSAAAPQASFTLSSGTVAVGTQGDLWLTTTGSAATIGIYVTQDKYWQLATTGGSVAGTIQINARRRKAFLVPQ